MVSWAGLLDITARKPGYIHEACSRFHNYSLGKQLLVLFRVLNAESSRECLPLLQVERIRPIRDGNGSVKQRQGKAASFFLEDGA